MLKKQWSSNLNVDVDQAMKRNVLVSRRLILAKCLEKIGFHVFKPLFWILGRILQTST